MKYSKELHEELRVQPYASFDQELNQEIFAALLDEIDRLNAEIASGEKAYGQYHEVSGQQIDGYRRGVLLLTKEIAIRDEKIAELRNDISGYRRTVLVQQERMGQLERDRLSMAEFYKIVYERVSQNRVTELEEAIQKIKEITIEFSYDRKLEQIRDIVNVLPPAPESEGE